MRRSLPAPALLAALLALLAPGPPAHAANPSATLDFDGAYSPLPAVPRPLMREGSALVYDPVRQRMIAFGGYGDGTSTLVPFNDVWALSLGPHPAWAPLLTAGAPPAPRLGHSMVYDSLRDRLLVYGGSNGGPTNARADVWELSLSGTPTWTQLAPGGTPPAPRTGHCAIYDPARDRMVVFGGYDGAGFRNDTWELDFGGGTPQWVSVAAVTPAALTPRDFAGAVYDPNQNRMVVCGGNALVSPPSPAQATDETWALNLAGPPSWRLLPVTGLGARLGHAAAYDALRRRLTVFGGYRSGTYLADAFTLDLLGSPSAWQPLAAGLPAPPPRTFTTGAYDPGRDRFLVFAGADPQRYLADVCALDLAGTGGWSIVDQPAARAGHTFSYDPNGRRGILFGGLTSGAEFNDAWVFDLTSQTWTELLPTGAPPPTRWAHVAVLDEATDRLIVCGGLHDGVPVGDVWALSLGGPPAWTQLATAGASRPLPGYGASAAYDGPRHQMLMVGGFAGGGARNDTWTLSLYDPPTWSAHAALDSVPDGRAEAGLALDARHGSFYWFGGLDYLGHPLADTWQLTLDLGGLAKWVRVPTTFPRGLFQMAVGVDTGRKRVIVIDGQSAVGAEDHVYALPFDLSTGWGELFPTGTPPSPRALAAAFYDVAGNRIVLTGGMPAPTPESDTWFLTFPEIPTPVLTTLVDESVDGARVHLAWYTPDGAGTAARAERTADGAAWTALGTLVADAAGRIVLDDVVPAGGRWGYRLRVGPAGTPTETTWLTAGGPAVLALLGASPNPAVTTGRVAFSLRGSLPAALAVYDVRGRAVLVRDLSRLGPGSHTLALSRGELGGAGVYLLRLKEDGRSLTRKLALLP